MAIPFSKPVVCPVLIGRTSDLAALRLLIDGAKHASGQTVLVSGEAGIGKSRLVAEAKSYAAGQSFLVAQGNCFQPDSSCPYAPLLEVLRSCFTHGSADVAPITQQLFRLLPEVVSLPSDPARSSIASGGLPRPAR